jgi:hypothetical protein
MIEAHDAATGYLEYNRVTHPINTWTITQGASDRSNAITDQLNCGARAFDLRPHVNKKGELIFHHDVIEVNVPFSQAIQELVTWSGSHTADEDLVLAIISHCDGSDCVDLTTKALAAAGVPVADCGQVSSMTLRSALNQSKLSNGGHVLAVFDCVDDNWVQTVTCSGRKDRRLAEKVQESNANVSMLKANSIDGFYTCYTNDDTHSFPVDRMFNYLKDVSKSGSNGGRLYSMQALWQETKTTVEIGELHFSSLLLDEKNSKLNQQVTDAVKQGPGGMFPHINLLEVNNVCDGGNDLLVALREYANEYAMTVSLATSSVFV